MKNSIASILLVLGVCAGFAFGQTKKAPTKRATTKVPTKTIKRAAVTKSKTATVATTEKKSASAAVTTESGLTYIITQNGTGAPLKAGDLVIVNYTGLLTDGRKFDSSLDRGEPIVFPLGQGKVIKGWDEALQKLRIGDRVTLVVPPQIGYGSRGFANVIPPDATLIFIVEIMGVQ